MPKKRGGRKKSTKVSSSAAAVLSQYGVKADAAVAKNLKNGNISLALLKKAAKYASNAGREKVKLHDVAMAKLHNKGGHKKGKKGKRKHLFGRKKGKKRGAGFSSDLSTLFKEYTNAQKELAKASGQTKSAVLSPAQMLKKQFKEQENTFKSELKKLESQMKLAKLSEKLASKEKVLSSWDDIMSSIRGSRTPFQVPVDSLPRVVTITEAPETKRTVLAPKKPIQIVPATTAATTTAATTTTVGTTGRKKK